MTPGFHCRDEAGTAERIKERESEEQHPPGTAALTMMLLTLFPVVLLSLRAALVDSAKLTYTETDPHTGAQLLCDGCPPGTYLRARCTSLQQSDCAPCPPGSFTELWNYIGKCLRCGLCGHNQVEKTACSADRECQCECKQGFHYERKYDMCFRHSDCSAGQRVLTYGTNDKDTVCQICPDGSYSDTVSAHQNCMEHKSCNSSGLQLLLRGSHWHDSVCGGCEEHQSQDGANYLREILPAFFVHQKIPKRRLHRVVNKLPSEDGKRLGGTSGLNLLELHQHINAWITSATAKQIRQLPAILKRMEVIIGSERLKNKLQRIDAQLTELCGLRN